MGHILELMHKFLTILGYAIGGIWIVGLCIFIGAAFYYNHFIKDNPKDLEDY